MAYIISVNATIVSQSGGTCVCPPDSPDLCDSNEEYMICVSEVQRDLVTGTAAIACLTTFCMGLFRQHADRSCPRHGSQRLLCLHRGRLSWLWARAIPGCSNCCICGRLRLRRTYHLWSSTMACSSDTSVHQARDRCWDWSLSHPDWVSLSLSRETSWDGLDCYLSTWEPQLSRTLACHPGAAYYSSQFISVCLPQFIFRCTLNEVHTMFMAKDKTSD